MRPAVQESPAAQSVSLLHPPSPSCLKVSRFHFENSNDTKLFGALGFLLAKIKLLRIVFTWHSPRQQSSAGSSDKPIYGMAITIFPKESFNTIKKRKIYLAFTKTAVLSRQLSRCWRFAALVRKQGGKYSNIIATFHVMFSLKVQKVMVVQYLPSWPELLTSGWVVLPLQP